MTPAVHVSGLTYRYAGATRAALEDVSLTIEPGELALLAGGSGSGKSTLLRAASGLVPHFHGGTFAGSVVVATPNFDVGGVTVVGCRPSRPFGVPRPVGPSQPTPAWHQDTVGQLPFDPLVTSLKNVGWA